MPDRRAAVAPAGPGHSARGKLVDVGEVWRAARVGLATARRRVPAWRPRRAERRRCSSGLHPPVAPSRSSAKIGRLERLARGVLIVAGDEFAEYSRAPRIASPDLPSSRWRVGQRGAHRSPLPGSPSLGLVPEGADFAPQVHRSHATARPQLPKLLKNADAQAVRFCRSLPISYGNGPGLPRGQPDPDIRRRDVGGTGVLVSPIGSTVRRSDGSRGSTSPAASSTSMPRVAETSSAPRITTPGAAARS